MKALIQKWHYGAVQWQNGYGAVMRIISYFLRPNLPRTTAARFFR